MNSLRTIIITLWIGSLWTMALTVIPTLFGQLDQKQALEITQRILNPITWIGFACVSFVLIDMLLCNGLKKLKDSLFWITTSILGCHLVQFFVVTPVIQNLRKNGIVEQTTGVLSGGFDTWHAISTSIFILQCILGVVFIIIDQEESHPEEQSHFLESSENFASGVPSQTQGSLGESNLGLLSRSPDH
jgi:hypothetical protein